MEEFNKKDFENMEFKGKSLFEKMLLSATLGMIRGIDIDLYSQTTKEMSDFIKDFQDFLTENNFSNSDLQILNNLLIQNRKIIKDLKKGENHE